MCGQLAPIGGDLPISLLQEQTVFGRDSDCDTIIPFSKISDRHCLLQCKGSVWWGKDPGSKHSNRSQKQRLLLEYILCVPMLGFGIELELLTERSKRFADAIASNVLASPSDEPNLQHPRRLGWLLSRGHRSGRRPLVRKRPATQTQTSGKVPLPTRTLLAHRVLRRNVYSQNYVKRWMLFDCTFRREPDDEQKAIIKCSVEGIECVLSELQLELGRWVLVC